MVNNLITMVKQKSYPAPSGAGFSATAGINHCWSWVAQVSSFCCLVLYRPQSALKTQRFIPADVIGHNEKTKNKKAMRNLFILFCLFSLIKTNTFCQSLPDTSATWTVASIGWGSYFANKTFRRRFKLIPSTESKHCHRFSFL